MTENAREELGVFPHNVSSCSPLIYGDKIYAATSNGVDWSHKNIPSPFSPALVVMDKNTVKEAIKQAQESSKKRNFKQTFDLIMNLKGLDMKKSSQ